MKYRTPLRHKPLRQAGQSLREERERLFEDRWLPWVLASAMCVALAVHEWYRSVLSAPPQPWTLTFLAVVVLGITAWKTYRLLPKMRNLRLGIEGEKAVGQFLERLHADGYRVFHDLQGPSFNVDHVLIGAAGIFTIETKTWNKPFSGARVSFDGEQLLVGGKSPERDAVRQARAQSAWLRAELRERSGREYKVRPVIVFPGWFVEAPAAALRAMWVLEPKALPTFLLNETPQLSLDERNLASAQLSRMARETDQALPN
jgi:Nuclease-related domain